MKKNKVKKQIKTDEWNEMSKNREDRKTKEQDKDWKKKMMKTRKWAKMKTNSTKKTMTRNILTISL